MTPEPRRHDDYTARQVVAARRVLVDLGQVLAAFHDAIVVVGGWVPDLLLPAADPAHVGSIDVDLALDAGKLSGGRYAELVKLLLETRRYRQGEKAFQLVIDIDLKDGEPPVQVEVELLASSNMSLEKHHPKLVENFRVLQFPAFAAAFYAPVDTKIVGSMASGASNTVHLMVASLSALIVMKAHAVNGRDKPKDVYDLCYCLDQYPGGLATLAADWQARRGDPLVDGAIRILRDKFTTVDAYGPQQLAVFHDPLDDDERAAYARRAFELVQALLRLL